MYTYNNINKYEFYFLIKSLNKNLKFLINKKIFNLDDFSYLGNYLNNLNLYYFENNKTKLNIQKFNLKNFGNKFNIIQKNYFKFNKTICLLINKNQIFLKNKNFLKKGELFLVEKKESKNTLDITQGLPKVSALLELKIKKPYKILNNTCIFFNTNNVFSVLIDTYTKTFYNKNIKHKNFFILNKTKFYEKIYSSPENILWFYFLSYIKTYSLTQSLTFSILKTQNFLTKTLNNVYKEQKININSLNFEIILKQMFSRIILISDSDTIFFKYEELNIKIYTYIYNVYKDLNYIVPLVLPKIFGITRSTIKNSDMLASISFQNTTNLIIDSTIKGTKDWLNSLKSNIIIGQEIPIGTNFLKKNINFDEIQNFINKI